MSRIVTVLVFALAAVVWIAPPATAQDAAAGAAAPGPSQDGSAFLPLPLVRGYITVDNVNTTSVFFPNTRIADNNSPIPRDRFFANYNHFNNVPVGGPPAGPVAPQNQLWGDWVFIDNVNNFAQGDNLVHIEADPNAPNFEPGNYTFYGRYVTPGPATDQREPLATTFGDRYMSSWDTDIPTPPPGEPDVPRDPPIAGNRLPDYSELIRGGKVPSIGLDVLPGLVPSEDIPNFLPPVHQQGWMDNGGNSLPPGVGPNGGLVIGTYYAFPGEDHFYLGFDPIELPHICENGLLCNHFHTAVGGPFQLKTSRLFGADGGFFSGSQTDQDTGASSDEDAGETPEQEQIRKRAEEAETDPALRNFLQQFGNRDAKSALNQAENRPLIKFTSPLNF